MIYTALSFSFLSLLSFPRSRSAGHGSPSTMAARLLGDGAFPLFCPRRAASVFFLLHLDLAGSSGGDAPHRSPPRAQAATVALGGWQPLPRAQAAATQMGATLRPYRQRLRLAAPPASMR
ncbi:hypothetical protein U9M48_003224 [Paspalum notatum var. saurae]|uniref:Uncharacterized protein n=1 Tax=Paspalum notatum var. saurae TaxID=547442 RepID=A0AAQ3PL46_PASNO